MTPPPPHRRRRKRGWVARALTGLACLVLGLPALALLLVWLTLPAAREEPRLPGLSAPVAVAFGERAVPRITAQTERDAAMALGWLHARDRLFQMEAMRRGAEGRLAEIAGAPALRLDRFTRTLGLRQRAEADLAALDSDTRDLLAAYAEGVNARIAQRGRFAAPEFLLLGAPEPWEPVHSLLWGKIMGLWLSGNWRTELERAGLARVLSAERLWDLWPADTSRGRPDVAASLDTGRLLANLPRWGEDAPLPPTASNAWAVMGSRSASGAPMLAADPHLAFGAPALWYLARIDLPGGRFLAGATTPGVPFLVIGRNDRVAWGFTTTHSDTQDVFVERLTPDGRGVETEDGPRPFAVRRETLRARFAEPSVLEVRETRNGPVISDLEPGRAPSGAVLAARMANLEPGDTAPRGLLALNRARTLADAREAARLITSPPQNLMVAEAGGGIAMYLTGRTPLRASGDGSLPAPGHDASHLWRGFVPFDALPHAENPESGLLVNANNRVEPRVGSNVFLGRDWFGDWRFQRIHQMLAERERHDGPGFARMQMDDVSLLAREALPFLRSLPRGEGAVAEAQSLLANWDGRMAEDAAAPLVWAAFSRRFPLVVLRQAGVEDDGSPEFLRALLFDAGVRERWCAGDCRAAASLALAEAVRDLAARFGPSPAAWRWGAAHAARFEHPLLRFVPGLNTLTTLVAPTGGDGETVHRASFRGPGLGSARHPFAAIHGAALRFVADMGDPDGAWATISTGQSGHPLSPHWGDFVESWRRGETLRLDRAAGPVAIRLSP